MLLTNIVDNPNGLIWTFANFFKGFSHSSIVNGLGNGCLTLSSVGFDLVDVIVMNSFQSLMRRDVVLLCCIQIGVWIVSSSSPVLNMLSNLVKIFCASESEKLHVLS